jgi:hypothetical protein
MIFRADTDCLGPRPDHPCVVIDGKTTVDLVVRLSDITIVVSDMTVGGSQTIHQCIVWQMHHNGYMGG